MIKKILNLVFLNCLIFTFYSYSQLEIGGIKLETKEKVQIKKSEGAWENLKTGEKFPTVWISMNSGKFIYELRHDQKYANGAIGISKPTQGNWYQSGMLNIIINGERFNLLPANNEKIEIEEGEIGKVKFSWETETAKVFLNFYLYALDDKLFMEVQIEPKKEINSLDIKFINYTGGFNREREHIVYTNERKICEKGWNRINIPAENWLLLTDEKMDYGKNEKALGPSAIAYISEKFSEGKIYLGGYSCEIAFKCKPEEKKFIFCLWEFPDKTNKEIGEIFKNFTQDAFDKMKTLIK